MVLVYRDMGTRCCCDRRPGREKAPSVCLEADFEHSQTVVSESDLRLGKGTGVGVQARCPYCGHVLLFARDDPTVRCYSCQRVSRPDLQANKLSRCITPPAHPALPSTQPFR